jgi:hypothetical protein
MGGLTFYSHVENVFAWRHHFPKMEGRPMKLVLSWRILLKFMCQARKVSSHACIDCASLLYFVTVLTVGNFMFFILLLCELLSILCETQALVCILVWIVKILWSRHYLIKFVSDLRQVGDFLRVLRFPPPIKVTATI